MGEEFMLKAFGRAAFITTLLIIVGLALWNYTLVTIVLIVLFWLTWMFYSDPPEDWS